MKIAIAAAFALFSAWAIPSAAADRPNIVVIMTDDQDDQGSIELMPEVQRLLVERGVRFTNSFVDTSLCCPSRTTLFTGQSAINHGVRTNSLPDGGYYAFQPREENSLGVWLQRAGYRTALMGKVLNKYGNEDPTHVMPGWDEWRAILRPFEAYFSNRMNVNGVVVQLGPDEYITDVIASRAVTFIERQEGTLKPFFLLLTPPAPHNAGGGGLPPVPPPRHDGAMAGKEAPLSPNFNEPDVEDKPSPIRSLPQLNAGEIAATSLRRQKRAESLLAVDDMVRRVVAALRRTGAIDNTVIVFTSDNGFALGAHRWDSKLVPYEESIRVPLVIRGPGIPENETRSQLVNNIDLSATIMGLAGVLSGNIIDGRSLAPVLADDATPWRTVLGIHGFNEGMVFHGARSSSAMFAQYVTECCGIEEEFYELLSDPYQLTNRAADPLCSAAVTAMRQAATRLAMCSGVTCWLDQPVPVCDQPG